MKQRLQGRFSSLPRRNNLEGWIIDGCFWDGFSVLLNILYSIHCTHHDGQRFLTIDLTDQIKKGCMLYDVTPATIQESRNKATVDFFSPADLAQKVDRS